MYQRRKASDMYESIVDTLVMCYQEYQTFGMLYPDLFNTLHQDYQLEQLMNNINNMRFQSRVYIEDMRRKGV